MTKLRRIHIKCRSPQNNNIAGFLKTRRRSGRWRRRRRRRRRRPTRRWTARVPHRSRTMGPTSPSASKFMVFTVLNRNPYWSASVADPGCLSSVGEAKNLGLFTKKYRTFIPKNYPGSGKKPITDPVSRGQKGTGSRIRIHNTGIRIAVALRDPNPHGECESGCGPSSSKEQKLTKINLLENAF